jgi:hypothetical protein
MHMHGSALCCMRGVHSGQPASYQAGKVLHVCVAVAR